MALLDNVIASAGLTPCGAVAGGVVVSLDVWPEATFLVEADDRLLSAAVARAGQDTDQLWPGTDAWIAGVRLVGIDLESVLRTRVHPPRRIRLTSHGWESLPPEPSADVHLADGDEPQLEWSAQPGSDS